MPEPDKSQLEKFKAAARDLETDDDEARFDERLKKPVKHKPATSATQLRHQDEEG